MENKQIAKLFDKNPGLSLDQGVERLPRTKIQMSRSTVRRKLPTKNDQQRLTIKKTLLTKIRVEKRMQWAIENSNTDWSKVVYTDESSFWLLNPLLHTWCSCANRTVISTIRHPLKVHVYRAFCEQGFGNLTIYTGNLDAARMDKCIVRLYCPLLGSIMVEISRNGYY